MDQANVCLSQFLADTRCSTQQQIQHDQATVADLTSPLMPDDSTRPAVRFQRDETDHTFLGTGTGIDRAAGSQLAGLLRLKLSMTWPSESAITCASAKSQKRSNGVWPPCKDVYMLGTGGVHVLFPLDT